MSEALTVVSKGEFAKLINVSPGRVSQMISERKIGPEALQGEGRNAKIIVDVARRQIADRTDIGQRFGNGIGTQLDGQLQLQPVDQVTPAAPSAPRAQIVPPSDPMADAIKRERLRGLQMANERIAEERLAEQGRYVRADEAKAAMARLAGSILTIFEGGLADIASSVAADLGVPQRDVLHKMRAEFRNVRAKAAEAARRDLVGMPKLAIDDIPDASDPAVGEA